MRSAARRGALLLVAAVLGPAAVAHADASTSPIPAPGKAPLLLHGPKLLATGVAVPLRGSGAPAKTAVTIERQNGSGWTKVLGVRSDARGRFAARYAPTRIAPRIRVRARAGDVTSRLLTVRTRDVVFADVGDVNLGDVPGSQIERFGAAWPWQSVGPRLRAADVALANLECAVSLRGAPVEKTYRFRGRPSSLKAAARVGGLDVVNLANNHAGDYGTLALMDTIRYARSFGLGVAGAGFTAPGALKPAIVTRLGLRIAVVGFVNILPSEFAAGPRKPGTAWATPDNVRRAVRAARRQADVVIATFHWGIERATTENAEQRALAQVAFGAGATAVLGGHPHVLQPIRDVPGRRLVAYSLGNFVFGAHSPGTATTGILELRLSARGVEGRHFVHATIAGGRPILR